jgi:ABC-type polysaccharide/polyol phosphate transport system ATPase subunit
MNDLARVVEASDLGKRYKIYTKPSHRFWPDKLWPANKPRHTDVWALQGLDIRVGKGRCLGVIGMNGAGKSTLLKLLTGVIKPTTGALTMNGEVLALLELGTGFNNEVSGRDNVFLTGKMLGYTHVDIAAKLDAIQAFADIGSYFEQPVKTYSSGMFVRLAFSLYVNLEPEILIVDEALSVGDFFFQQKCATAIRAIKERGTTILFVSHDMSAVHELCDEVILLDRGRVRMRGDANSVISGYHIMDSGPISDQSAEPDRAVVIDVKLQSRIDVIKNDDILTGTSVIASPGASLIAVRIIDPAGNATSRFPAGSVLRMEAIIEAHRTIPHANFGLLLADDQDRAIWSSATSNQGVWFGPLTRGALIVLSMELTLNVPTGIYSFNIATGETDPHDSSVAVWNDTRLKGATIEVLPSECFADRSGIAYLDMTLCTL